MNILDKEFVHIGTDKIYKELWQNINIDQTSNTITKPYGGLYCSDVKDYVVCYWLDYVENSLHDRFEYISTKPACLIKLKDNTKILMIDSQEDLFNFKNSYLIINFEDNPLEINNYYNKYKVTFLPNYEKISNLYDAIYINPYLDNAFLKYSIPTLLITNPDCIEYYRK